MASERATAELLWAACRPEPVAADVAAAVAAGADVEAAAHLAISHRVSPLFAAALARAGVSGDGPGMTQLAADVARCHAQSRLLLPLVGRLAFAPLADAGVDTLVIKGAALAPRYPDPAMRPMDDVDLIAPADGMERAIDALVGAGWEPHTPPHRRQFQLDLTHRSLPGLHIDLHRDLANWRTRANALTSQTLWAARQRTELYGAPAFVLPPERELVLLAAHAAKPYHGFDRLIWIVDIAVVAGAGVDWDTVEQLATDAHCRTALAVALAQATRLGLASPPHLRALADPDRNDALRAVLAVDWPTRTADKRTRNALRYALVDDRRRRATLLLSEVFERHVWNAPIRAARVLRRRFS